MLFDGLSEVPGRGGRADRMGGMGERGPDDGLIGLSRGGVCVVGVSGERFTFGHPDGRLVSQFVPKDANVGFDLQEMGVMALAGPEVEEVGDGEEEFLVLTESDQGGGLQGSTDLVEGAEAVGIDGEGRLGQGVGMVEGHVDGAEFCPIDGVGFRGSGRVYQVRGRRGGIGGIKEDKGSSHGGGALLGKEAAISVALQAVWATSGLGGGDGGRGGGEGWGWSWGGWGVGGVGEFVGGEKRGGSIGFGGG